MRLGILYSALLFADLVAFVHRQLFVSACLFVFIPLTRTSLSFSISFLLLGTFLLETFAGGHSPRKGVLICLSNSCTRWSLIYVHFSIFLTRLWWFSSDGLPRLITTDPCIRIKVERVHLSSNKAACPSTASTSEPHFQSIKLRSDPLGFQGTPRSTKNQLHRPQLHNAGRGRKKVPMHWNLTSRLLRTRKKKNLGRYRTKKKFP